MQKTKNQVISEPESSESELELLEIVIFNWNILQLGRKGRR